jgi:outer membrane lipoprotein SlyB
MSTVIGVFDAKEKAENAVNQMRNQGFTEEEISILAKGDDKGADYEQGGGGQEDDDMGFGTLASGTTTGGVLGGLTGLLAGIGAFAIPGVGPIVAAGPLAAMLSGVVAGGVAGGLVDLGIPQERGEYYESKVKEGKILTVISTDDNRVQEAADILRDNGATDVESH